MRYLPLSDADRSEMLRLIGAGSVDELFRDVPEEARLVEGTSLEADLDGGGDAMTVQARVVNSAGTRDGQEIGLQFLITDEAEAGRLAALADRLIDAAQE